MSKTIKLYRGVYRCGSRFKSQIQRNDIQTYLGMFDTEIEAARAYDRAAMIMWGVHAKVNFPGDFKNFSVPILNDFDEALKSALQCSKPSKDRRKRRMKGYCSVSKRPCVERSVSNDSELTSKDFSSSSSSFSSSSVSLLNLSENEVITLLQRVDSEEASERMSIGDFYWSLRSDVNVITRVTSSTPLDIVAIHFVGVLSYHPSTGKYLWMGTWIPTREISETVPSKDDFIHSLNYFEFHSNVVPSEEAIVNKTETFLNSQGMLCGLLRPNNTHWSGSVSICDGGVFQKEVNPFAIDVKAVRNCDSVITKYKVTSPDGGLDGSRGYTMSGEFDCASGLLVMTRSYVMKK